MIYLLDANAFMEAARLYYGFDMAPGFWNWLQGPGVSGRVGSVNAVRDEILAGEGELVEWARTLPDEFWMADTSESIANMRNLAVWASHADRTYGQPAVAEFLASADMRLIAIAMAIDGVVATREVPAPRSKKKVKIPDACMALGVRCITPFEAYRALGMKLT